MESEIERIISLLKQTFEKGAWHGPSVKEGLQGITEEQALQKLPDTHSILELVGHMTAWRHFVERRIKGDISYSVSPEMNFPKGQTWQENLENLDKSQEALLASLEKFPPGKLPEQVPNTGNGATYYSLLHGIIHHDLYHTAQIILIRKATSPQPI
jgi:uncharacterized damage-inducible protein DinB